MLSILMPCLAGHAVDSVNRFAKHACCDAVSTLCVGCSCHSSSSIYCTGSGLVCASYCSTQQGAVMVLWRLGRQRDDILNDGSSRFCTWCVVLVWCSSAS